ncbi:MAG: hypothetical protein J7M32_12900 [Deltaproteobacteria bacterium]|nr:hypothetical protein [Deltaproteobacteria bacterium]
MTYQWGKPQLDECENAKGGTCPPQISHSRDQPGGPERKKNPPAPALGSQLCP